MSDLRVPTYLDLLAGAGVRGIPVNNSADADAIEVCRSHGLDIRIIDGRGRLLQDPDVLVPLLISKETRALAWGDLTVEGFFRIGSTNDHALDCARKGAAHGLVVYAEQQTAGRGRQGRKWNSPARAGLYFSVLVRPQAPQETWPLLTLAASVALVLTLEEFSESFDGVPPLALEIKWPNDVLLAGRKTAGILLEIASGIASGRGAVIGVGINVTAESIPPGLEARATAVGFEAKTEVPRRWLLVHFLEHFQKLYLLFEEGDHNAILQEWKKHSSMWNGAPVQVIQNGKARPAVTCGLTKSGALRIRTEDGKQETVVAADVSVRRD